MESATVVVRVTMCRLFLASDRKKCTLTKAKEKPHLTVKANPRHPLIFLSICKSGWPPFGGTFSERRGPKPKPKRHRDSVSGADGDPTHAMRFASLSVSPRGGGAGPDVMMTMEGLGSADLGAGSWCVPLNSPSILDGVARREARKIIRSVSWVQG